MGSAGCEEAVDCMGRLRKTRLRQQAVGAGLAAKLRGCEGGADLREKQSQRWLWTMAVATAVVGETPSLTGEFLGKWARDQQRT